MKISTKLPIKLNHWMLIPSFPVKNVSVNLFFSSVIVITVSHFKGAPYTYSYKLTILPSAIPNIGGTTNSAVINKIDDTNARLTIH